MAKVATIRDEETFTELCLDALKKAEQEARCATNPSTREQWEATAAKYKDLINGLFAELESQEEAADG